MNSIQIGGIISNQIILNINPYYLDHWKFKIKTTRSAYCQANGQKFSEFDIVLLNKKQLQLYAKHIKKGNPVLVNGYIDKQANCDSVIIATGLRFFGNEKTKRTR